MEFVSDEHGRTSHRKPRSHSLPSASLWIGKNFAVPIGLCVNELATNAVKHAFPDGKGAILIGLKQQGDAVRSSVSDNGIGVAGSVERPDRV
jgi:two-component sensor histidine kinase